MAVGMGAVTQRDGETLTTTPSGMGVSLAVGMGVVTQAVAKLSQTTVPNGMSDALAVQMGVVTQRDGETFKHSSKRDGFCMVVGLGAV
jgi:hypothetical protein